VRAIAAWCIIPRMQTNEATDRERKRRAHRSRSEWLEEAKKWRATGKPAEDYAGEHGLNPRTLTWWASRLSLSVRKQGSRKKAVQGAERESRTPRFLPLRVVEHTPTTGEARSPAEARAALEPAAGPCPVVASPPEARCDIEVVLLNGRRVRFGAGVDETVLVRVLKIAEGGIPC
jgi:hypothetical protein